MTHRDYEFQSPFILSLTLNQSDSMSMHSKAAQYVSQTEIRFNQLIKKCQSSRQSTFAMCVVPTSSCYPYPSPPRVSGLQDPASWLTPNLSGAQPHTDAQIQRYSDTRILGYSDAQRYSFSLRASFECSYLWARGGHSSAGWHWLRLRAINLIDTVSFVFTHFFFFFVEHRGKPKIKPNRWLFASAPEAIEAV